MKTTHPVKACVLQCPSQVKREINCETLKCEKDSVVDRSSDKAAGRICARWTGERGLGLVIILVFIKLIVVVVILAHVRNRGLDTRSAVVGVIRTRGHCGICTDVTTRETGG